MTSTTHGDTQKLLGALRHFYIPHDLDAFPASAMALVRSLLPNDFVTYYEVSPSKEVVRFAHLPEVDALRERELQIVRHLTHLPQIEHFDRTGDGHPHTISDFMNESEFRHLSVYKEFFCKLGVEFQMTLMVRVVTGMLFVITINRCQQDFSEDERALLDLAYPHLCQGFHNARRMSRIKRYLGRLHDRVVAGNAPAKTATSDASAMSAMSAMPRPPAETSSPLALSARESEILKWVAQGKTNWETSQILSLSPRTVQKHLEHVFQKLGVENRMAAVLRANATGGFSPLVMARP